MQNYIREDEDLLNQDPDDVDDTDSAEDAEANEAEDESEEFADEELLEEETFFKCPYCYERISMLLDPSSGGGEYIEDCEVCCRPIQISFEVEDNKISDMVAVRAQD